MAHIEPRKIQIMPQSDVIYHEYTCVECDEMARNTYCEPFRTNMLERRLCYTCNHWREFKEKNDPSAITVIDGHLYGPGNRTSGAMRGMAGRRFDIEYIEPSIHAGKRTTTFDLWSGGQLPERVRPHFPDTARFLGGAKSVELGGPIYTRAFDSSDTRNEPYPLPQQLGIRG
jgi:hypothetical protein